jgi:D-sedoheptulose 7-phosphate isomerase
MSESRIYSAYQHHSEALEQSLAINADRLETYAKSLAASFADGQRLIIVSSGQLAGVAATLSNAFLYRLEVERPALPVLALQQNIGLAATLGESGNFPCFYSCQLQAQANANDHVLFLDCGETDMMMGALKTASDIGCVTSVITCGNEETWKKNNTDLVIPLVTMSAPRGIEAVLFLGHLLCELVESELFGF